MSVAVTHARPREGLPVRMLVLLLGLAVMALLAAPAEVLAHGVAAGDKGYIQNVSGILPRGDFLVRVRANISLVTQGFAPLVQLLVDYLIRSQLLETIRK